jgi:hypothetical protein
MRTTRASSFLEAASIPGMPPVILGLKVDASRMIRALQTPDAIGAIIRIHKDLDRELKRIVRIMVPDSSRMKLHTMSQRIECLKAAGLPEKRLAAPRTINLVRNAFAHGEKETFDRADVDELLKAIRLVLGDDYSETALHDLTTDPYGQWDYQNMDHKGQFCLHAFIAVGLVASVKIEFEKHSFRPKFPKLLRLDQIQEATKQHTFLLFLKNG